MNEATLTFPDDYLKCKFNKLSKLANNNELTLVRDDKQ